MTKAVDRQVTDPTSVLAHYKAMLAFRKAHPALIRGTIKTLDAPEGVLAFLREGEGDRLYCAFNMSEKPVTVPVPAGFELTASDAPGIDYEPQEGALSLAPFGAYIGVVR
jgi:alpha-glucosidase